MDYELKCVIAICFLVKIAALSQELPIGKETENSEQGRVEPRFLPSSAASAGRGSGWALFDREPGRRKFNQMKDAAESRKVKENQTYNPCEHRLELLGSSLKWRDIRKTLHWLERILASNQTAMESCHEPGPKGRKVSKRKKTNPELEKILLNDAKAGFQSKRKKERGHRYKSWKNRSRGGRNRKGKLKSKQKKSRFDKNYFQKKNSTKVSRNNPPTLNATILKPDSVLYDVEKMLLKRTKTKGGLFSAECGDSVCGKPKGTHEKESGNLTGGRPGGGGPGRGGPKSPKQRPWPRFVYHRVSSNLLHPELTRNHKQSAYIAISVVSSGKPDSTD